MKKVIRNNGLSIVLLGFFLVFLVGQAVAGFFDYNQEQESHGQPPKSFGQYVVSSHFLESVFENWESEFLQMAAYVVLTVCLFQQGSAESKDPEEEEEVEEDPREHQHDAEAPGPVRQGGWRLRFYAHSLSLALMLLFLISWVGHALSGHRHFNNEQAEHGEAAVTLGDYLGSARFWFESFQNWQSEFLAVAAIVVLSIWLREKGSPESKPVHAPHHRTGS